MCVAQLLCYLAKQMSPAIFEVTFYVILETVKMLSRLKPINETYFFLTMTSKIDKIKKIFQLIRTHFHRAKTWSLFWYYHYCVDLCYRKFKKLNFDTVKI